MKDSFWFKHDSTAGRDIKLRKIQHIYGHEGKGLFWDVIEVLREEENYSLSSDDNSLQMLCELIGYKDVTKFINWFNDCVNTQLFIKKNGLFYSKSLMVRMKVWNSKKANGMKAKMKRIKSEFEANEEDKKRREENLEIRRKQFIDDVGKFKDKYDKEILNSFYRYWSEKTKKGEKMKWETEETWELSKRLVTWESNSEKFKRK